MKIVFWIKLALGVGLIVLLAMLGYRLVDALTDFIDGIGSIAVVDEEGYVAETPEPVPTMPPYMQEDSFYDSPGNMENGG